MTTIPLDYAFSPTVCIRFNLSVFLCFFKVFFIVFQNTLWNLVKSLKNWIFEKAPDWPGLKEKGLWGSSAWSPFDFVSWTSTDSCHDWHARVRTEGHRCRGFQPLGQSSTLNYRPRPLSTNRSQDEPAIISRCPCNRAPLRTSVPCCHPRPGYSLLLQHPKGASSCPCDRGKPPTSAPFVHADWNKKNGIIKRHCSHTQKST